MPVQSGESERPVHQEKLPQAERLRKLNQIAIQQMRLLIDDTRVKRLEAGDK